MAIKRSKAGIWADTSTSATVSGYPTEYLCDLESEIPAGVEGDGAYAKDTHKYFKRKASGWVELSEGGVGTIPAGLIAMFAGLIANIPSGWVLCDGANSTPDLRSKFVKGAAAAAEAGNTGGAATHTHADHAALTHSGASVAAHASHTHDYTQVINHTHTVSVTDPGHTHVLTSQTATTGGATSYEHGALDTSSAETEATEVTVSATTGITASTANPAGGVATGTTAGPSASLTHTVTQPDQHTAQSHDTVNSEPAFYTVLFIMKA